MAVYKCKMCGGTLDIDNKQLVATCQYCGTKQTLPKLDDNRKATLYERANHFRRNNDFDKAMSIYEEILKYDSTDAESYWSIILCRYGIEYVEDITNNKRVPTINRTQFTSVFDDENYKSALQYADNYQREIYEAEAIAINDIQKGILAISQNEKPFDVFICYKETDANGRRTQDSVLATELYKELTDEGFKVFFSRITLEDKLGIAYEPYIFAALHSAKVMVVLGTKSEHFNAVWVKNEWSRYLALIKQGAKKTLIPAYSCMTPNELPEEFSHLQAQDMSKIGFMQDLTHGIKKIVMADRLKATSQETVILSRAASNIQPLLKRVFMFLEDGEFERADEFIENILNLDPENAMAYLGKMMIEFGVKRQADLANCQKTLDQSKNYQKILRFGDNKLVNELTKYNDEIKERNVKAAEKARKEIIYNKALDDYNSSDLVRIENALEKFISIKDYKNSEKLIGLCQDKIEQIRLEIENEQIKKKENEKLAKKIAIIAAILVIFILLNAFGSNLAKVNAKYEKGVNFMNNGKYEDAISVFTEIIHYRDSKEKIHRCNLAIVDSMYIDAEALINDGKYSESVDVFRKIALYEEGQEKVYMIAEKYLSLDERYYAAISFGTIPDYKDSWRRSMNLWHDITVRHTVSAGWKYTVALKKDRTVVSTKLNFSDLDRYDHGQNDVSSWRNIIAVSAGWDHTVGLKADGTVVAVGNNEEGKCDVGSWENIVSVFAASRATYGLKMDGTIVSTSYKGTITFDYIFRGTVMLEGDYSMCELTNDGSAGVEGLGLVSDLVDIASGSIDAAVKKDGTVIIGIPDYYYEDKGNIVPDVSGWSDIVDVEVSLYLLVGLKSDGTVVFERIDKSGSSKIDVSSWKNIIAISANCDRIVGLTSDGKVLSTSTEDTQLSDWDNIKLPNTRKNK